jgi:2,3-bisphosphoglycerate-dependent phosphoglycerate mutase
MATLVLLRHGESEWNSRNLFTGWVDVDLTPRGEEQATRSAHLLRAAGLLPTAVHTSVLTRAVRSAEIVVRELDRPEIPVRRDWRLNERCYGALQGMDRRAARERFGDELYTAWRRSYDGTPPPLHSEEGASETHPRAESLADVVRRLLPYWREAIVPDLRAGGPVLVVAHGNSLRALVAHLDALSPEEVLGLNIPTGMPLRYDLDDHLRPLARGGRYLEPERAAEAAAVVAAEGS